MRCANIRTVVRIAAACRRGYRFEREDCFPPGHYMKMVSRISATDLRGVTLKQSDNSHNERLKHTVLIRSYRAYHIFLTISAPAFFANPSLPLWQFLLLTLFQNFAGHHQLSRGAGREPRTRHLIAAHEVGAIDYTTIIGMIPAIPLLSETDGMPSLRGNPADFPQACGFQMRICGVKIGGYTGDCCCGATFALAV